MSFPPLNPSFRRVLQVASWVGLALSLGTLFVSTPRLVAEGGGWEIVLTNLAQYGWTLSLLLLAFAWTRTIGLRALTGAALFGFFGVGSMAVLIGKPLVQHYGQQSQFVMLLFAPMTEELLKLMPVAVFLLLSMRSRRMRPSVADAVLLGVTVASGFTMYENILYGRPTGGSWFATLPFSVLLPFISRNPMLVGTHVVYTGLASLGLALTVIYGRRFPMLRWALPAALVIAMSEHAAVNRFALMGIFDVDPPWWTRAVQLVTLNGYLSTLLFVSGVVGASLLETRVVLAGGRNLPTRLGLRDVAASLTSSPRLAGFAQLLRRLRYESMRRSVILATAQTAGGEPDAATCAAVNRLHARTDLAIRVAA